MALKIFGFGFNEFAEIQEIQQSFHIILVSVISSSPEGLGRSYANALSLVHGEGRYYPILGVLGQGF